MKAKELGINLYNLSNLNLEGRGGSEKIFSLKVFSNSWKRESCKLHDFRNTQTGILIELKKQQTGQWFDPGKHYLLSEEEKNTLIMFCLWDKKTGAVDALFTTRTIDFIQSCFPPQQIKYTFELTQMFPGQQSKVTINIRKWFHNNRDKVNLLYIRNADIKNV